MPIYEFQCQACGHRFERLQKLSDADPAVCPSCGEPRVGRMLSAPSFRLAGSGWYETDFKKDGDKKRNLAGEGGASAEGIKADTSKADAPKADAPKADAPKVDAPAAKPAPAAAPAKPASAD